MRKLASYIDHTLLKATATPDDIRDLCEEAAMYGFAAVCVNPVYVDLAAHLLAGSGVKVATVVGFPLGANLTWVKEEETRQAVRCKADEIDMVISLGAAKSGQWDAVANDVHSVVEAAEGKIVKAILETCCLDDDEKCQSEANFINPEVGGRAPLLVSEPGLYSLILRSRKPEAKAFKRWITHEVIPAIRRAGGYMAAGQNDTPESIMARAVLIAQDTITRLQERTAALETQAEVDRPKVVFADSIEVSKSTILVGELAKLVKQSTGHDIGQRRMFDWLRDNGFLHKRGSDRNMPTQKSMDMGLIVIKEGSRIGSSGESHITKTPKVTGKGQIYFVNRFREILDGQQGVRQ